MRQVSPDGLRRVLVLTAYTTLFLGLDWALQRLEPVPDLGHWCLPAGLSFGLLLRYGLKYAPAVFGTCLMSSLWIHAFLIGPVRAVLVALALTATYAGAVAVVRSLSGPEVLLKSRREVAAFLPVGLVTAFTAAGVGALGLASAGRIAWGDFVGVLLRGSIGEAAGILALTPFVIHHAIPFAESRLSRIGRGQTGRPDYRRPRRAGAIVIEGLAFLIVLSLALWAVFGAGVSDDFQVFCLFTAPLVWLALGYGIDAVTLVMAALAAAVILSLSHFGFPLEDLPRFQILVMAASLVGLVLGSVVTERKLAENELTRRDALLESIGFVAEQLLDKAEWERGLEAVLARLGEVTGASRVHILEIRSTERGLSFETASHEWAASGPVADPRSVQILRGLRCESVEQHANTLYHGQAIHYRTKDLLDREGAVLASFDIRSSLLVPIFVEHRWWGCLGLDQSLDDREWSFAEINALKTAAHTLGILLASVKVEQQFRQLTGNIHAVFWISSPDGARKTYVSPAYADVWGRTCSSLYEEPNSWLEAIYPEDQSRIREALAKQMQGEYDEEYRVVRPDTSVRWIRDRAFPVRDQSGQVYRVVGIAEDITKRKEVEEKLRTATALLYTLIDNLQYGILVEDEARRITHVNQAFCKLFNIAAPVPSLLGVDSRLIFTKTRSFARRIQEIIQSATPSLGEELSLDDGRVFKRDYIPLSIDGAYRYHLWQYRDITIRKRTEEQIKGSLKEKEVLLKEIHHRVKNNLQVISSLLSLQAAKIEDANALQTFKESQNRVKAMALIHERLYESPDLAKIDFAGYVRNLTGHLLRSYQVNSNIRLTLDVEAVPMNIDIAIPCGLIINELVSNSLKYAFPNDHSGEICIKFAQEADQKLRLVVRDNGVGFPRGVDYRNTQSLGLQLVRSLTDQLGGTIAYHNDQGIEFEIGFSRARA